MKYYIDADLLVIGMYVDHLEGWVRLPVHPSIGDYILIPVNRALFQEGESLFRPNILKIAQIVFDPVVGDEGICTKL